MTFYTVSIGCARQVARLIGGAANDPDLPRGGLSAAARMRVAAIGRLHVLTASGIARLRGSGAVAASGLLLLALAKLLTRTGGRRIDAADGLPVNSRIHGRRTRRVRAANPDN